MNQKIGHGRVIRQAFLLGLLAIAMPVAAMPVAGQTQKAAVFKGEIDVFGSLRAMMHENQVTSQIALETLPYSPQLFGLGALEGLAGEVLILEGKTYVSYPDGDDAATTKELQQPAGGAALLVTAQVEAWDGFVVQVDIAWQDFDSTLTQWVERAGWDPAQRLPFQIVGTFPELQWHVIDGSRLEGGGGSHEDHLRTASRLQATAVDARVVGFYSPSDQGVFTHHSSVTHMHCLTEAPQQMGHVDDMVVPAGARVLLPSRTEADALQLVDGLLAYLGAPADRQAIASLTTEAECRGPSGQFTTTTRSIRPDQVYFEQVFSSGRSRFWSLPQQTWGLNESGTILDVPNTVRSFVRGHEFHLLLLEIRQRFSGFRILGPEEREGDACQRIAMQDENGNPSTMLLRQADHQLMELVLNPPGAEGAVVVVPHIWKERQGVRWFRGFVLTEGTDRVFRYRYTRIEPNTVEGALFDRPKASRESEEDEH